jgi:hypothetical protein
MNGSTVPGDLSCRGVPAANHAFKESAEVIAEFTRSK